MLALKGSDIFSRDRGRQRQVSFCSSCTDSFKLDQACIQKGKAPPLLTSYEYMIARLLDKADNFENKDINEMLVKSTILHGKLFEVVKDAEDPKSDKGTEISKIEKKEIMEAIKNLEDKIMKIKITVDQK